MACHLGVLPAELLQALSCQMDGATSNSNAVGMSGGARFLRLPHPRTGIPSLFLPYELQADGKSAILEVQAVTPPNPRSWFMPEEVVGDGKLLMMTPVDSAFLLIPILRATQPTEGLGNFRPAEDIFEDAANRLTVDSDDGGTSTCSDDVLSLSSLSCIQAAMRRICDVKDITPEIVVYRYSPERVQVYLRTKVARLAQQNLSEMSQTLTRNFAKDGLLDDGRETLLTVARLQCACDLVSQYLPRDIYDELLSSYDFAPLDAYLKVLKGDAMALAAVKMSAAEARESRGIKEKKDSAGDKKRKAKGSMGVEKLKKANTKGMSKLSTFFQKK